MLKIIHHRINKISLSNSFHTCYAFSLHSNVNTLNETDLPFLPIEEIEKLPTKQLNLAHKSFNTRSANIKNEIQQTREQFKTLGLTDACLHGDDIQKAQTQWRDLKQQLQNLTEKKGPEKEQKELQKKIYLLESYIYSLCKTQYLNTLCNFIRSILIQSSNEQIYLKMTNVLQKQAEYIIAMGMFKKNVDQYKEVLNYNKDNFSKEQEEVTKMYQETVQIHKKNVKYIENKCQYNTQKCLLLTITQIEQLNTDEPEKLRLVYGLLETRNITIKHKQKQILQKLETLGVPEVWDYYIHSTEATNRLIFLTEILEYNKDNQKIKQQVYLLQYYLYLYHQSAYIYELGNFINSILNNKSKKKRYLKMLNMLKRQSYYIESMVELNKNGGKSIGVLPDCVEELKKGTEEVQKIYNIMVVKHKENTEYIEPICKKYTQKSLLLTIGKIDQLPQEKLSVEKTLLKTCNINIRQELTQLSEQLQPLELELAEDGLDYNDINKAQDKLTSLTTELDKNATNHKLKKQVYILAYYIYLLRTSQYVVTLEKFIALNKNNTEERYLNMADILKRQSEYIIEMENFHNKIEKYKEFLTDRTDKLQQAKEEVKKIYTFMKEKYKENITYVETICEKGTQGCIFLTIPEIEKLKTDKPEQLNLVHGLVRTSSINLRHERNQISQKLSTLGLAEAKCYDNDINKAENTLTSLTTELSQNASNQLLQQQVALLVYYIYLWRKSEYIAALGNVIYSILNNETEETRYEKMSDMLKAQSKYIIEMKHFPHNVDKYMEILTNYTDELHKTQEDIHKTYWQIVDINTKNITYVENQCEYKTKTQECLLWTIDQIEKLKTATPKKSRLVYGLVRTGSTNLRHERNQISQKLATLGLAEAKCYDNDINKAENTLTSLTTELEQDSSNQLLQQQVALLVYYIYLFRKSNYLTALSNVIYSILNNETEETRYAKMSDMLKAQSKYIIEMKHFPHNVDKYMEILTDKKDALLKEKQTVIEMYEKIVDIHKDNITYIKNTEPYNKHEGLLSTIKNIEEQQLSLKEGLSGDDFRKSTDQSNQVSKEFHLEEVSYDDNNIIEKVTAPLDQLNVFIMPLNSDKKNKEENKEEEKQKTETLEQQQQELVFSESIGEKMDQTSVVYKRQTSPNGSFVISSQPEIYKEQPQLSPFVNSVTTNETSKTIHRNSDQQQHTEQKPNKLMNIIGASILFLGLGFAYIIVKCKKKLELPQTQQTIEQK